MTLENIENHVLERAEREAKALTVKAKTECEQITSTMREETDNEYEITIERLTAELKNDFEKAIGSAKAENRMALLTLKTRILDNVFQSAIEKLVFSDRYWDFVRARLAEISGMKGEILCRAEHRDRISKMCKDIGGDIPPMSDESVNIHGGFILKGAEFDLDASLEAQMANCRENILPDLMNRAFPR